MCLEATSQRGRQQIKDKSRDKARDDFSHVLNSLGVQAKMAERGRDEEKVHNSWYQRSLGVIDLSEGPIRWINVVKKDRSKDSPPKWWINFCIPDERLISDRETITIRTVREKSVPLFGKVVDVTLKGEDHGTGLVNLLSNDEMTKSLATEIGNLEIRSYSEEFQGWTL